MKKSSVKWIVLAAALAFGLILGSCSNETTETVTKSGSISDLPRISELKVQAGDGTQGFNKPVLVVSWKAERIDSYPVAYVLWVKGKDGGIKRRVITSTPGTPGSDLRNDMEQMELAGTIGIDTRPYPIWDDNRQVPYFGYYDAGHSTGYFDTGETVFSNGITDPDANSDGGFGVDHGTTPASGVPGVAGGSYYVLRNKKANNSGGSIYNNTNTLIPLLRHDKATLTPKNSVVLDSGIKNPVTTLSVNATPIRADGANFDPPQNWAELSGDSSILATVGSYPLVTTTSSILAPGALPGYRIISPDRDNTDADRWFARIDLAAFIQALTQIADVDTKHSINPMELDYDLSGAPTIAFSPRNYQDVDFEYQIGVQAVVNYKDTPDALDCDDPRFFIDPADVDYAPQTIRVFSLYNVDGYTSTTGTVRTGNSTEHNDKVTRLIANTQSGKEKVYQLDLLKLNNNAAATPAAGQNPNVGLKGLGVLVR